MSTRIHLPAVYERDMDLLLLEELASNDLFRMRFLQKCLGISADDDVLEEAFHSADPDVRRQAVHRMSLRPQGTPLTQILNALSDADWRVRREAIWKAFKSRSVYATSGARIILSFHINGHPMGKVVYLNDESEARDISGEVIGNDEIREVVIIKNGFTLHTIPGQGLKSIVHYLDKSPLKEGDYYYLRAIQKDGEMAWSSPIWVERKKDDSR